MSFEEIWQKIQAWGLNVGIKIIVSIVILVLSFMLINLLIKAIKKRIIKNPKADKTLTKTVLYILKIVLKILVVVGIIGYLGIDTTGVSALIASAGVAVGLAVNGTLSNFAGGVMILVTRPFKEDDYISALGHEGTVEAIRIIHTVIKTPDNKTVYLPNGELSSSAITNYTQKGTRRVDLKFYISYKADYKQAENIIKDICSSYEYILQDKPMDIGIAEHGESSIVLFCKVWAKSSDYWTVNHYLMKRVKSAFDEKGIEIPYNQLDVHIKND